MNKRLLCLGLLAVVSQFFLTGCLFHPVARWRANHPYSRCGVCGVHGPCSCVEARRPIMHRYAVADLPGDCHGCNSLVGAPVSMGSSLTPATNTPTIGYPMPITPGPTVVPSFELHPPMQMQNPMPKSSGN